MLGKRNHFFYGAHFNFFTLFNLLLFYRKLVLQRFCLSQFSSNPLFFYIIQLILPQLTIFLCFSNFRSIFLLISTITFEKLIQHVYCVYLWFISHKIIFIWTFSHFFLCFPFRKTQAYFVKVFLFLDKSIHKFIYFSYFLVIRFCRNDTKSGNKGKLRKYLIS